MVNSFKEYYYDWDHLIKDLSSEIGKLTGNVMSEKQRPMIESRLKRRMNELGVSTPDEYREFWSSNKEEESKVLVGLLTTHFTSFFREFSQFEWLAIELPQIISEAKNEGRGTLKFWSTACSRGQEVWSLAMWLNYHIPRIDPKMDWKILGSDIDGTSLNEAQNGVYHRRELETAPRHLWDGLWSRGKGDISDWYCVKEELKKRCSFITMNLLNFTVPQYEKFDVILCRNVLIYFNRNNQEEICKSILNHLNENGVLITGLSESLSGYGLSIKGVSPSIYKRQSARESLTKPVMAPKKRIRILCVDDSPTVLTILKKILNTQELEVVGSASNGLDAIRKIQELSPDVITLDLHMPVMDGITFLKKTGISKTIPVIIVSSVNRENVNELNSIAELGISDFIEKPTLSNMHNVGDEIGQKIKMGLFMKNKKHVFDSVLTGMDVFKREAGFIAINFGKGDFDNVYKFLSSQAWGKDVLFFVFDGSRSELEELRFRVSSKIKFAQRVEFFAKGDVFQAVKPLIWLHFSVGNPLSIFKYRKNCDVIIAEEFSNTSQIEPFIYDVTPSTSFSYLVNKVLGEK